MDKSTCLFLLVCPTHSRFKPSQKSVISLLFYQSEWINSRDWVLKCQIPFHCMNWALLPISWLTCIYLSIPSCIVDSVRLEGQYNKFIQFIKCDENMKVIWQILGAKKFIIELLLHGQLMTLFWYSSSNHVKIERI